MAKQEQSNNAERTEFTREESLKQQSLKQLKNIYEIYKDDPYYNEKMLKGLMNEVEKVLSKLEEDENE